MNIIIRNLIRPHKILPKIIRKINFYIKKKNYKKQDFEEHQNNLFSKINLNRNLGIKKLDKVKNNIYQYSDRTMSSEHEILFACLSINSNFSIKHILEIGTFDGVNSLLLSSLFKETIIDTIDLDEKDENFYKYYGRKDSIEKFIFNRSNVLSKNKNINFKKMNSVKLITYKKKYDLIWIDGAHGYPVVCIDIINSLHILQRNGLILCDDVYLKLNQSNSDIMYSSIATYETLKELKRQDLINFRLIYKRLSAEHNCIENTRKFVAIVSKK